jgi:predicted phosphodiesterase
MTGLPYTQEIRDKVLKLIEVGLSHRQIQEVVGISLDGISRIRNLSEEVSLPIGKHETIEESVEFPAAHQEHFEPFHIEDECSTLVISDIHIPYHDRTTVELAIAEAKRRNVKLVILNGDILDYHELSVHDKDPLAPRYVSELATGKQFLTWLRHQLPKARIVYKQGNHEDRLERYVLRNAPAFWGIEAITTPELLEFKRHSIEWVADKRIIALGKLNVIHGHEYRGGVSSPVNPARGLYLKAGAFVMAGHHHQSDEYHNKGVRGNIESTWSLGCGCHLQPAYLRFNRWSHGFAFVETYKEGNFFVENLKIINGKLT